MSPIMADPDHRALIKEAKKKHRTESTVFTLSGRKFQRCTGCSEDAPCLTARLATALEQEMARSGTIAGEAIAATADSKLLMLLGAERLKREAAEHERTTAVAEIARLHEVCSQRYDTMVEYAKRATGNEISAGQAEHQLAAMRSCYAGLVAEILSFKDRSGCAGLNIAELKMVGEYVARLKIPINRSGELPNLVAIRSTPATAFPEYDRQVRLLCDDVDAREQELLAARTALEAIREATNLALPSEQTGPEWEQAVRVPVLRLTAIDAALASVFGNAPIDSSP